MDCLYPVAIKRKLGNKYILGADGLSFDLVPCGKCPACRRERSKAWAVRLMLETLSHDDNCFITLTYDDDHLNFVSCRPTLVKEDLQNFFKRLRKDLDLVDRKIKYYAVGEYGDHFFRPHYHIIAFGLGLKDTELIRDNWNKGNIDVGDVTLASCNYVSGYVQKKLYGDVADSVYLGRLAPFSLMSKRLAFDYLVNHVDEVLDDGAIYFNGRRYSVPRYFWRQMLKEDFPLSPIQVLKVKNHLKEEFESRREYLDSQRGIDELWRLNHEDELRSTRERTFEILDSRSKGVL